MDANNYTNTATKQDIIENIYSLINEYHNPELVKPNDAPNSNIITHIYSDGEITEQKGGFAYLQRGERTIRNPIGDEKYYKNIINKNNFPMISNVKDEYDNNNFRYAIVLEKHANEIRNEMLKLV